MKREVKLFIIMFLTAICLEVFIFNFRSFESLGYESKELFISSVGKGLEYADDGSYIFSNEEDSEAYIEIEQVNTEVENLYIDLSCSNKPEGYRQFITVFVTDEGNGNYIKLPYREIVPNVERSKYIKMNTSGVCNKILLRFEQDRSAGKNSTVRPPYYINVNSVSVNKPVPFSFNFIRFIIIFGIIALLYCLRYNTKCFDVKLDISSKKQKIALLLLILFNILFAIFIYKNNLLYYEWDRKVYVNLAESLLKGRFDLPMLDVSENLLSMSNPYDTNMRNQFVGGADYAWDYAFYNGKYYVYFGIVPCLILFLPLKAIFNYDLPVNLAAHIFTIIYIVVSFRFLYTLIRRYFKNTSFLMYLMMVQLYIFASALFAVYIRNDLYEIPNLTALIFTMLGLDLWITSIDGDGVVRSRLKVLLGSLCMALVAGCRPQFLLASFFAVFIFRHSLSDKAQLLNPRDNRILNILAFSVPYVVIGAFLMYYNYARFGSVTDFGAMYNLTTNDMTKRGFNLDRMPYGIFAYLFQLPEITTGFPYLGNCPVVTKYMGVTIVENMRGGIFIFNSILFLNFIVYTKSIKSALKEKGLFKPIMYAQIFALAILFADINMAGVVIRYAMDFTWLLMLCAFGVYLTVKERVEGENLRRMRFAFSISFIISMIFNILLVFVRYGFYTMDSTNSDVFYAIASAVEFWM